MGGTHWWIIKLKNKRRWLLVETEEESPNILLMGIHKEKILQKLSSKRNGTRWFHKALIDVLFRFAGWLRIRSPYFKVKRIIVKTADRKNFKLPNINNFPFPAKRKTNNPWEMQNTTKIFGLEIQFTVFALRINFRRSAKQIAWLRLISFTIKSLDSSG